MTAYDIVEKYITFFEKRGHKRIANSPLVPQNDPTTLFTSSGMQPLVPYLLGEIHPSGTRLVNVQNSFRAQDFDEVGDNRHTTMFRMLGNWSLGDYFKEEQLPWFFEFLTDEKEGLGLDPQKLYVTVFSGDEQNNIPKDTKSIEIWKELFKGVGIDAKDVELVSEEKAAEQGMGDARIFAYAAKKNWWSRSGVPENMPAGEPGGPDSEVFYDFGIPHDSKYGKNCHPNCDCGRFLEIGNSVFMQYIKKPDGAFENLPKQNVDFGGGLERLLAAQNDDPDIFKTTLFYPIVETIEQVSDHTYATHSKDMRMIVTHLAAAIFIINAGISPSNTDQGYMLRRSIRRAMDSVKAVNARSVEKIIETIVEQYKDTDSSLVEQYEEVKNTILEESTTYTKALDAAKKAVDKELSKLGIKQGDELMGTTEIPAELAFKATTSYGLGPTQLKSLGYSFDEQKFAEEMKKHQDISRAGAEKKFKGGLADHSEKTIMGHTATHLLHQALRDVLGTQVHQSGSNITTERVRFDFNHTDKLTDEEIATVEKMVNDKIQENLPVHFEIIPTKKAYELGAIGLFMDTYGDSSKIYFIGDTSKDYKDAYSIEFCGGPHVNFTGELKSFKIIKQENLGKNMRRIYAAVG
jgi:alanyl-tRNA synthetase